MRIKNVNEKVFMLELKNGVRFGRPKAEIIDEFISFYKEWKAGQITATEAIRRAGIKRTTFYMLVKEYKMKQAN